jgi:hypothetical protein
VSLISETLTVRPDRGDRSQLIVETIEDRLVNHVAIGDGSVGLETSTC